jgi:hypothetical protein
MKLAKLIQISSVIGKIAALLLFGIWGMMAVPAIFHLLGFNVVGYDRSLGSIEDTTAWSAVYFWGMILVVNLFNLFDRSGVKR